MAYGSLYTDIVQSSTAGTPPQFNDGNGTQTGVLCRAWVNYKGTATRGINASFNISSVTVNGTGDFTYNFTNAMPDANYAYSSGSVNGFGSMYLSSISTTSIRLVNTNTVGTSVDGATLCMAVFR